jgi:hypothetical protein
MKSSQKNRLQAKNTNIVHIACPNVYASTAPLQVRQSGCSQPPDNNPSSAFAEPAISVAAAERQWHAV